MNQRMNRMNRIECRTNERMNEFASHFTFLLCVWHAACGTWHRRLSVGEAAVRRRLTGAIPVIVSNEALYAYSTENGGCWTRRTSACASRGVRRGG